MKRWSGSPWSRYRMFSRRRSGSDSIEGNSSAGNSSGRAASFKSSARISRRASRVTPCSASMRPTRSRRVLTAAFRWSETLNVNLQIVLLHSSHTFRRKPVSSDRERGITSRPQKLYHWQRKRIIFPCPRLTSKARGPKHVTGSVSQNHNNAPCHRLCGHGTRIQTATLRVDAPASTAEIRGTRP